MEHRLYSYDHLLHGQITKKIVVNFLYVYNELGTGFLESVYHIALERALRSEGLRVEREVPIEVFFRYERVYSNSLKRSPSPP